MWKYIFESLETTENHVKIHMQQTICRTYKEHAWYNIHFQSLSQL